MNSTADDIMQGALDAYDAGDFERLIEKLVDYDDWLEQGGGYGEEAPNIAEALYWLCSEWHGGQWCPLYEALCINPFKPGPLSNGPEPDSWANNLYSERTEKDPRK